MELYQTCIFTSHKISAYGNTSTFEFDLHLCKFILTDNFAELIFKDHMTD
jgi:hypothetical protein